MRINNNLMAMNTHRQLGINSSNGAKSIEKLSSGYRINRAGDDAAGLAISEKMRAQVRGLNQASRNGQDGISLIQTAEGALNETQAILQRMRELAVQSANDTNVNADRTAIQNEIDQLIEEVDRIGDTTEFNTQKLLNGNVSSTSERKSFSTVAYSAQTTFENVSIDTASQLGTGAYTLTAITDTKELNGMSDQMHNIGVSTVDVPADTALGEGQYFVAISATKTATLVVDDNNNIAATTSTVLTNNDLLKDGDISISTTSGTNTLSIKFTTDTGSVTVVMTSTSTGATVTADFGTVLGTIDVTADAFAGTGFSTSGTWVANHDVTYNASIVDSAGTTIGTATFTVNEGDQDVEIGQVSTGKTIVVDFASTLLEGEASFGVKATGVASAVLEDSAGTTVATKLISASDDRVDMDYGITFATDTITNGDSLSLTVNRAVSDESLSFQIGANSGQQMNLGIEDMRANALGIDGIDVSTSENASLAMTTIDTALSSVSSQRAQLGAVQNRLEHSIKNIDTSSENLQAAESRVRDVDMAKEMMEFTKNNILQQAAQAMLAQANQAPQGVLQLLR